MLRAIAVVGLVVLGASPARADVTLVFESPDQEPAETARLLVADGRLALQNAASRGRGQVLFDAGERRLTLVDDDARSYLVLGEENARRIAAIQSQIQQHMKAQVQQLPAEQRERAMSMMRGVGTALPGAGQHQRVVRTGATDRVDDIDCSIIEFHAGEELLSRQCVVNAEALGIDATDYEVIAAMQQFIVAMIGSFDFAAERMIPFGTGERREIPIRFEHFGNGGAAGQLRGLEHDAIEPEQLAVPADYAQERLAELEQQ